ncbi:YqaA family protein [Salinicola sp. MH3R3-1]
MAMLFSNKYLIPLLLLVATLGNVLGSAINWYIGRHIDQYSHRRWFPCKKEKLDKTRAIYLRHGRWVLVLSWMPIVGDPLTIIAGFMREPLWSFLLIVTFAKGLRYLVIAAIATT